MSFFKKIFGNQEDEGKSIEEYLNSGKKKTAEQATQSTQSTQPTRPSQPAASVSQEYVDMTVEEYMQKHSFSDEHSVFKALDSGLLTSYQPCYVFIRELDPEVGKHSNPYKDLVEVYATLENGEKLVEIWLLAEELPRLKQNVAEKKNFFVLASVTSDGFLSFDTPDASSVLAIDFDDKEESPETQMRQEKILIDNIIEYFVKPKTFRQSRTQEEIEELESFLYSDEGDEEDEG